MESSGHWRRPWRAAKTVLFLFSMVGSLLLFSAPPLLVAILDIVVPTALLNASPNPAALSLCAALADLRSFDFQRSLVDVPLLSVARSILVLCVYSACDVPGRSRGPYLGVTMLCSVASAAYVAAKALAVFGGPRLQWQQLGGHGGAKAVMVASMVLAVAHVLVAYRTCCRERRKLVVYRIDLEAVPLTKTGFDYHKSCK